MREVCVIGGNRYFGKRLISATAGRRGPGHRHQSRFSAPPAGSDPSRRRPRRREFPEDGARFTDLRRRRRPGLLHTAPGGDRPPGVRRPHPPLCDDVDGRGVRVRGLGAPVREDGRGSATVPSTSNSPGTTRSSVDAHYGEGKRQAEAVLAAGPDFPYVAVRVAHVLGGDDDFTGRLDHYASRIRSGEPIAVPAENHPATYIHVEEIADFLAWTVGQDFTGPVNAASHGPLTTEELCDGDRRARSRAGGAPSSGPSRSARSRRSPSPARTAWTTPGPRGSVSAFGTRPGLAAAAVAETAREGRLTCGTALLAPCG